PEGPSIALIRLDPGARIEAGPRASVAMRFVYEGEVEYGGREYPAASSLYYPAGEDQEGLTTRSGCALLSLQFGNDSLVLEI
ncbi:MAG: hypothetical protein JO247_13055, partial [Chloroflexi bacterium]|nr:hypothetical protein [Chloroflexota bacterium]